MTDQPTVTRNDDESRYEIHLGETLAGFARFRSREGEIHFIHTEVDPAFQGKGLAGVLAAEALADAVASGWVVVPYCPYIASHLRKHGLEGGEIRWPQLPDEPTSATGGR